MAGGNEKRASDPPKEVEEPSGMPTSHRSKTSFLRAWCFLLPFWVILPPFSGAEECFINKECVGVIEPSLIERECFLYAHELNYRPESEMRMVMSRLELDPDQLHAEFVRLVAEKKIIGLKYRTPIFSCGFDLERVSRNPDEIMETRQLAEFNCNGAMSKFVPVRPVNYGICYWVALENVECR